MAKDIPGYYFDPEKGKYFKIQPNHAVPSAVKYSKQAVDAQMDSVKRRKLDGELQIRHLRERIQRPRLLGHPLMNRVRIRNAMDGVHGSGFNVTTELAAYYGAGLSRTLLREQDCVHQYFTKFAIDEVTAAMITASTGHSNRVIHHTHAPQTARTPCTTCVPISVANNPVTALLVTPRPANYIMWASSASALAPGTIQVVPFGREPERAAALTTQRAEDPPFASVNYDNMGTYYNIPESDIWDIAASTSGRRAVAACSSGLLVLGDTEYGLHHSVRKSNDRDFIVVSFKDENIVFGGKRSGTVGLLDLRSVSGTMRLRHGSGVTAVRALSNDNYVVVRGLKTMSIYDLRYTPMSKSLSKAYMTFAGSYASDRFGLGFDYDPLLGLIATAHSSSTASAESTGHHVSLFSTRTGKIVPSPLNSYYFPTPVTCIQFTNAIRPRTNASCGRSSEVDSVGDDGRPRENNEPKSIVTASGGRIDEWSVQGLGAEDERQE